MFCSLLSSWNPFFFFFQGKGAGMFLLTLISFSTLSSFSSTVATGIPSFWLTVLQRSDIIGEVRNSQPIAIFINYERICLLKYTFLAKGLFVVVDGLIDLQT
jgi:hypothetical protein